MWRAPGRSTQSRSRGKPAHAHDEHRGRAAPGLIASLPSIRYARSQWQTRSPAPDRSPGPSASGASSTWGQRFLRFTGATSASSATRSSRPWNESGASRRHTSSAKRILQLATRMEGLLIKACQYQQRADGHRPCMWRSGRLQDRVPARPFREVAATIERELGAHPTHLSRFLAQANCIGLAGTGTSGRRRRAMTP